MTYYNTTTEQYLVAIRDLLVQQNALLKAPLFGYPPHANGIQTFRIPLAFANTPIQGPDWDTPEGFDTVVKADPNNPVGSFVYVGYDAASANNINQSYPLVPNEAVSYGISNMKILWFVPSQANLWIILSCEKVTQYFYPSQG